MQNKHDDKKLARGSANEWSDSWERYEATETAQICYLARGRGMVALGDSVKAARLALEQEIRRKEASGKMSVRAELTDEPIQSIQMLSMNTVGYVFLGDEETMAA